MNLTKAAVNSGRVKSQTVGLAAFKSSFFVLTKGPLHQISPVPEIALRKKSQLFVLSVPKRIVKSAVLRNTVKRVARHAWQDQAQALMAARTWSPKRACLLKLVRAPDTTTRAAFKLQLRQDIDLLLLQWTSSVSQ